MATSQSSLRALTLGAIGVVYGDIGTSVLYAVKEVFGAGHVPFTTANVMGILSIFFWTLTVIISLKYVTLVLRADNNGEGGLVAMLALASQSVNDKPKLRKILLLVGIFGTCLFYGDGVITPAISVLSAVEGLEVVSPNFKRAVIPLTLVILFGLFAVQKRGTADIGKFFGPITLVWFAVIAILGVSHIVHNPEILWALSPHYAVGFMWDNPLISFIILGAVVLCVTGGGTLCRYGPFWQKTYSPGLVFRSHACINPELFWAGCFAAEQPGGSEKSIFHDDPRLGLAPVGRFGHIGNRDRLSGIDYGGVFCDQTSDPARLFATVSGMAHQCERNRSNFYAVCELGLVCIDCVGGDAIQIVQ